MDCGSSEVKCMYVRRFVTFGGVLYGWFSDITRIPSYVDDANNDPEYIGDLARKFKRHKRVSARMLLVYYQIHNVVAGK